MFRIFFAMANSTISILVAIAQNGVIGAKGGLPWQLSSDLQRFKRDTMGKPIIMGRKTWESIGRPLPGRSNIVVTRDADYKAQGADVVLSLKDAFTLADVKARCSGVDEICLIGGGQLYSEGIKFADRLYVTHVMAEPDGDTMFPEISPQDWKPVLREEYPAGEKDSAPTIYVVYERIPQK